MFQKTVPLLLLVIATYVDCSAQKNIPEQPDTTRYWRVETNDGNEFIGKIRAVEAGVMTLQTEKFGTLTIKMTDIASMEQADPGKLVGNEYWADNFQSTRYFWMPNGFGLKPGEAYYQNVWIFFNQFTVGVTKNLSLSAGTIPIFLLGAGTAPVWINGKVSLPVSEKFHIGGGALYLTALDLGDGWDFEGVGLTYGVFTFGGRDKNASLGIGYGFSGRDFAKRPVITFASMTRLGSRSYLLTENYLFMSADSESVGLLSVGGRRLIKRVGFDFGAFIPISAEQERIFILPWLGLSMPLGKPHREN